MIVAIKHNSTIPDGPAQAAQIQSAIDRVHEAGGGVVAVNAGCYVTTTLFLRSGVALHLERGARLQAWPELSDYPEAADLINYAERTALHLVTAIDCENIALTGDGVIDGRDQSFWEPCTSKEDRPYSIFRFKVRQGPNRRPNPLIHFVRCRNVRLDGFTVQASPGWALHVYGCDCVSITGITIRGHRFGPHTDGIGINGSSNVRIAHCDVDTGDDAIIVKATGDDMECRNVTVTNCIVASNCAGLGLGADVCGSISDVIFSNCVVKKSLRMIQVEMWYPGEVRRAVFSGITGRTFPDDEVENERPVYVDIQEHTRKGGELGTIRDMVFRDILCESRGRIMMTAQDGAFIDGITLDTVVVDVPEIEDPEAMVPRSKSMQLSNFNPATRAIRAAVVADNVKRLMLHNVEYHWPDNPSVPMHGLCCRNVEDITDDSPRLRSTDTDIERSICLDGSSL